MTEYGPKTESGQLIFREKYAQPGETYREMSNRIAAGLCDNATHYHAFRGILGSQKFIPGGRICAAIGTSKNVCAHNCFVSGTIEDSYVEGPGSIMSRAHEAASTMRMGGGIGYDFSGLRPRGALIKRLQSNATGPVSFMEIFNAVGLATCSSGHRRGALMGILRVDHPDVEEFIHAKNNGDKLTGFNISVAITDDFMVAVETDTDFDLRFDGSVHRTVRARELWDKIMRSAWDWAEPGVVFIDRMNLNNNLGYCETIAATNPCSEQPLPPFGACLLGSFNLAQYVGFNPFDHNKRFFDYQALELDIPHVVRAMDTVNDVAKYPLPEQLHEALQKRRMGLGVMGFATAIEALGKPYGSSEFMAEAHKILGSLANTAYQASARLAQERGPFPAFVRDEYMKSPYIQSLSEATQEMIYEHGSGNSHLISFAPTGTISMMADQVTGGIEPAFSRYQKILVNLPNEGPIQVEAEDYGSKFFGTASRWAEEVSASEHVNVLCLAQRYSDSAVSKTCNVTGAMEWNDFKAIYHNAWRRGAKSCSVYNRDGKRGAAIEVSDCPSGVCEV